MPSFGSDTIDTSAEMDLLSKTVAALQEIKLLPELAFKLINILRKTTTSLVFTNEFMKSKYELAWKWKNPDVH